MNIKNFKLGTLRQEYQYKSFIPEKINHTFRWDEPQINTMLEDSTRALGELNVYTIIVSNVQHLFLYSSVSSLVFLILPA